jgi:putative thioredoxin
LTQARSLLEEAHAGDLDNQRVIPDLANVLIDLGELEQAKNLLDSASASVRTDDEMRTTIVRLGFAEVSESSPPIDELIQAIEKEPRDCESRYRLGALHVGRGEYEAALEQFIEILRMDRAFRDDAGRKGLLSVFEMLGNEDPLVGRYRAQMSSLLY